MLLCAALFSLIKCFCWRVPLNLSSQRFRCVCVCPRVRDGDETGTRTKLLLRPRLIEIRHRIRRPLFPSLTVPFCSVIGAVVV